MKTARHEKCGRNLKCIKTTIFFAWRNSPPVGQGLLIVEDPRSHSDTPHMVGLLWRSDQPKAETSTWQHTTFTRKRHPCAGGIGTHNPSKRVTADLRLRRRGHWDWQKLLYGG